MNRSELHWGLNAVLSHVGKKPPWDVVVLTKRGSDLLLAASDSYTLGLARIPAGPSIDLVFTASEATELLRFVRPTVKATLTEDIVVGTRDLELHIGLPDSNDSAVFDAFELDELHKSGDELTDNLITYCHTLYALAEERDEQIYDPKLLSRFASAKRDEGDRLRMYPRAGKPERAGLALVTVGEHFLGAIAGMSYDQLNDATVASFLQIEGKAA